MSHDILQAARSYYGLADTEACMTQIYTNQDGQTCVAFEIPLSNEDFAAIVQRMQNMQQPDTQPDTAIIEGPTVEDMREAYNALSKVEKGRYGSFARYMAESSDGLISVIAARADNDIKRLQEQVEEARGIADRQVVHVDAPEEPEPVSMDAVWLDAKDCSQAQMMHASDADLRSGRHLVPWAMLTEEQKQKADKRYVCLRGTECSDVQKEGALDYDDETYTFAIPWCLLTDEQKQKAKEAKP